jgi:hypothetical protein
VPPRTLPTPLSKLAKLVFSYHGQIAKLEDFSPFSSSIFLINKLERQIAHRRGKREEGRKVSPIT